MDKLLILIEEGDSGKILSEKDLNSKLNELNKYGLVEIKDDKIFLTAKGKAAMKDGVDLLIRKEKRQQYLDEQIQEEENRKQIEPVSTFKDKKKATTTNFQLLLLSLLPLILKFISGIRKKLLQK